MKAAGKERERDLELTLLSGFSQLFRLQSITFFFVCVHACANGFRLQIVLVEAFSQAPASFFFFVIFGVDWCSLFFFFALFIYLTLWRLKNVLVKVEEKKKKLRSGKLLNLVALASCWAVKEVTIVFSPFAPFLLELLVDLILIAARLFCLKGEKKKKDTFAF